MGPVLNKTKTRKNGKVKKAVKLTGLCLGCARSEGCTFPRNPQRPISHCDEFEGFPLRLPKVDDKNLKSMVLTMARKQAVNAPVHDSKGICQYCLRNESCTFPKKPGGTWSCDEYQENH